MTDIKRATKVLIEDNGENYIAYSLQKLSAETGKSITHLPYSIRVRLENQLRNFDDDKVHGADIDKVLNWDSKASVRPEIHHMPARVVMQGFTGVPAVVDLAAMRPNITEADGIAKKINPLVDNDMCIGKSV